MAKKQSRRSVSVSRSSFESLRDLASALGVSMAQLVEQAIEALTTGKLEPVRRESAVHADMTCSSCGRLGHKANRCGPVAPLPPVEPEPIRLHVAAATPVPPRDVEPIRLPAQLTEPALVQKPHLRGARGKVKHADLVVAIQRVGLCAICTKTAPVQRTQLDVGGPLYDVCNDCNDSAPTERDHLFGGSSLGGVGEGNRRAKSAGTGSGR